MDATTGATAMTKWLTWEQFKQLGSKCAKCDKMAKWLAVDGKWDCYCDEHYPFLDEEKRTDFEEREK